MIDVENSNVVRATHGTNSTELHYQRKLSLPVSSALVLSIPLIIPVRLLTLLIAVSKAARLLAVHALPIAPPPSSKVTCRRTIAAPFVISVYLKLNRALWARCLASRARLSRCALKSLIPRRLAELALDFASNGAKATRRFVRLEPFFASVALQYHSYIVPLQCQYTSPSHRPPPRGNWS